MQAEAATSGGVGSAPSRLKMVVGAMRVVADDAKLFSLVSADGSDLPAFDAGAHVDLHLRDDLVRSYSLLPTDDPRRYDIAVRLSPGGRGGSLHIHEKLKPGQHLDVASPRNNFPLVDDADHSVLIAGGIGVTPIYAMLHALNRKDGSWELHYAFRTFESALFLDELRSFGARSHLYRDDDSGRPGIDLSAIVRSAPPNAHLYCCGPKPMIDEFLALANDRGPQFVHVERFQGDQDASRAGGYWVELAKSGKVIHVAPGMALIDVLIEAGVDVAFSCREGVCGSCETEVIAGLPDHRDAFLTQSERAANKLMMVCCSGALSERLVLNI